MVGRGTRLDPTTGKLMFRVYDYTDATRLFGQGFTTRPPSVTAIEARRAAAARPSPSGPSRSRASTST